MRVCSIKYLLAVLSFIILFALEADATLIPSQDGMTVYDTALHVTWLANTDLAAPANNLQFGLNVNPDGSMKFATAVQWVAALNAMNGGVGYLGHNNWQLPANPLNDSTCSATGPNGNFGFGCLNSDLGSLFYHSLGLRSPDTAVSVPANTIGPFINFQPYLYWSDTTNGRGANSNGFDTFSFNTGWQGGNVDFHYMYVLPMIPGKLAGTPPATGTGLEVNPGGQTIYDRVANVTWLADADLAKTKTFGAQCVKNDGTACIDADGSMSHPTALNWIDGMNASNGGAGWLGQTNWQMPPTLDADVACDPNYGCDASPMGELFYDQLGLSKGNGIPTPSVNVGPFNHVQPYLYWATCQPPTGPSPCTATLNDGVTPAPAPGFEYSFSFGNGLDGTDIVGNGLYVMIYYPAALVTVNGRALTADGHSLRNATVSITDSNDVVQRATTSSFGLFSFANVAVGDTYVVRISSRLYRYQTQTVQVSGNLTLPDFVGLE